MVLLFGDAVGYKWLAIAARLGSAKGDSDMGRV